MFNFQNCEKNHAILEQKRVKQLGYRTHTAHHFIGSDNCPRQQQKRAWTKIEFLIKQILLLFFNS